MGVMMINGVAYGGDNSIICTQAEYNAWEQAGTLITDCKYYISDAPSDSSIQDNTTSLTTTWSSTKISGEIADVINDTTASSSTTYSSTKINTSISAVKVTDLADTNISNIAVGDTLTWNGSAWVNGGVVNFASQIQWNSNVTVEMISAYKILNICIITFAIRANGLQGQIATLPHLPNGKYFNRIQNNNNDGCQYIVAYTENSVGKLGFDVAPTGAGLIIGEITYMV